MKLASGTLLSVGIVVLACASTIAVFVTREGASTQDDQGRKQNLLASFHSEDMIRLELSANGPKIAIERDGTAAGSAHFRLVEPVKEIADPATVDKFLSTLESARALRPVEQGPAPSALGLAKPALRASVRTKQHSYEIALGGSAPTPEGSRYVQVSVDQEPAKVVVIAKAVAEDLAVELDAFRLRSLVAINESEVTRIGITGPKWSLGFQRSTGTNFLIDAPNQPKVLANREVLKTLFFVLGRLTASVFLSDSEAETALGTTRTHFEIALKDAKNSVRFEVGGSCPGDPSQLVVIRRAPDIQRACAPRELQATLELQPQDFVDRRAFSLHSDEVEELDISGGKSKFALLRKGSGFVLHAGSETQVELEAGNQRISELLEAEGERVPFAIGKLNEFGLDPAPSTVTLRSSAARDSDVSTQVVRVGKRDEAGNLFVYREQDAVVLRIPRDLSRGFAVDSTLLYARRLTEFGLSSFISAEIEQKGAKQVLRRKNDGLQLEEPKGFDADGVLSSDLIQALGALTAERFVADRDDGSFGLQRSALRVRFVFKNGEGAEVEHHLRFGDETALGVFATLKDDGPVFILARSVRDTCQLSLINRAVFPASSDALKGVVLEAHGRTLQLVRQGERFTVAQAGNFPQDRVAPLLEALSNLRPEAALHSGPALPSEGFSAPSLILRLSLRQGPVQTVSFGAGDSWRGTSIFYVRVSGIDATFVMAQSKVRALSDAL
ncbi:MAG TPA: DUF4340 domain-containing protein [Polyangiaceae bacterium]|nr:DUF4340 domain-containing protein [Polyangiaceae bacterium]